MGVTSKRGGRPRKEIDKKIFENLCGIQCTEAEILAVLEITDKTLNAWCKRTYGMGFSDIYKEKRNYGKMSLRRAQFRLAEKNAAMAIFLGKNILGQSDNPSVETDESDDMEEDAISRSMEAWANEAKEELKEDDKEKTDDEDKEES